ncbi:MAG: hypothetical protein HKN50_12010 [Gammaproteobacteria bacterium]|nr:hypothetical protein [Gammaproteobacteria bacterium]
MQDHSLGAYFCNLDTLTAAQRAQHHMLASQLRPLVREFVEIPEGYVVHFQAGKNIGDDIESFLALERLCCPFMQLVLQGEVNNGLEVLLTGPPDAKPFMRTEFEIPE